MMREGYTKLYNFIWQYYLPEITGAQFKILIVVLVQTVGWNKDRDWISHEQFMYKTGLSRSAVTRSLVVLEQKQMIVITSEVGAVLKAKDRKFHSRLYYQISKKGVDQIKQKRKKPQEQRYFVPSTRDKHKRDVAGKKETKKDPIRRQSDWERIIEIYLQQNRSKGS